MDTNVFTLFNCMEVFFIANNNKNGGSLINEEINVPELMVIGPGGEQLGVKKLQDALTIANFAGLDLVLMSDSGSVPVGKIMDYNKYRYEKQKKIKEQQKKQRESNKDVKEYRLTVNMDIGDFNTRKKNALEYLNKGHKIKATLRFKGRQMAYVDQGKEVLMKFANELSDVAEIEEKPNLNGRVMSLLLAPKNK